MSILAECSQCHKKQAVKNRLCACGADLVRLKKSKKIKYWISYRLPNRKQKREAVGYSIEEARDAEGKRRSQKRENRIFDIKPDSKMTFQELTDWYLGLKSLKNKAYYPTLQINLKSFNAHFGNIIIGQIKPIDLENYQIIRKEAKYSDSYVDQEVGAARTMINKAFDNDLISGDTLRTFKKVKKLLKRNANARNRILSIDEYSRLYKSASHHLKPIIATAYYTGMREGEILKLTRDKVSWDKRCIELEASDTKDKERRNIPLCKELYEILKNLPLHIYDKHLFLYKGHPLSDIRNALKRTCRDAKILYGRSIKDGFVFHDLRHTFNTNMRKAGVSESVIMAITGHSTREMFDRYNTVDEDDTKQAVMQMENFLQNVDQNVDQATN